MTQWAGYSGDAVIRRLQTFGYKVVRQKGSHVRLAHPDPTRKKVTVPMHKEIGIGLLKQIVKDADISPLHFLNND